MATWRLYVHEDCGHCMGAIERLFLLLDGEAVTVHLEDADGPVAPDGADEAAPLLVDEKGLVVWMMHPDDDATVRAARKARRRRFAKRPTLPDAALAAVRQAKSAAER